MNIGKRLENIMLFKRISQTELSKLTGVTQTTISDIIKNKNKNPSIHKINELAKGLKIPVDVLLTEQEENIELYLNHTLSEKQKLINKIDSLSDDKIKYLSKIVDAFLEE